MVTSFCTIFNSDQMMSSSREKKKGKRLQVPVAERVASDMEKLAGELEVSVSRLGQRFIEEMLRDKKDFGTWLQYRLFGKELDRKGLGWRQLASDGARLQITIWETTEAALKDVAQSLNHSTVRCAALVLDYGLDRLGPAMKTWNSWPLSVLLEKLPIPNNPDPEKVADEIEPIN